MKRKISFITIVLLFVCLSLAAQRTQVNTTGDNVILVDIADGGITIKDLADKVNNLPEAQRTKFKTVDGQKQILDMMITEQLFYKKAIELGIDKREDVINDIHRKMRSVVNKIYMDELLKKEPAITAKTIQDFYNENIEMFTIPPRVTIQHLQTDRADLAQVQNLLAEPNSDFLQIIETYSKNEQSHRNKGLIRNIRLNGFIPNIGADPRLESAISEAEVDPAIIHGPFETSTGVHFFKKIDFEPSYIRPFEEVQRDIEMRLNAQRDFTFTTNHIEKLMNQYNVVILNDVIDRVNPVFINPDQRDIVITQGNHPEVRMTLGDFSLALRLASQDKQDVDQKSVRDHVLRQELNQRVIYAAGQDARIREIHKDNYDIQQVYLGAILSNFVRLEITNKIQVTEEELMQYYHDNAHRITVPTSRNIRQFVAKNEKDAKKHHKAIARMLKRDQIEQIVDLIQKESLQPVNNGEIRNIYANGRIPGLDLDETYNKMVFDTKPNTLSPIFRNKNGELTFFYITSETPSYVRPLADVEISMRNNIRNSKINSTMETYKQELMDAYNVAIHYDRIVSLITPEELFALAEESQKRSSFSEAIIFFDYILSDFPNSEHAYKALFMKAFVTAEDLKDSAKAIALFQEFLAKYSEGDLNESAEFMLEALLLGDSLDFFIDE